MDIGEAEALLAELGETTLNAKPEVGIAGTPPHHYAYLKLTSPTAPGLYAIVSTPGTRWFELEVAGGFNTGRADDLATDEEVIEYVNEYLQVARAYLDGRWSIAKSRLFRLPFVVVHAESGAVKLGLSIRDGIKYIFTFKEGPKSHP